VGGPAARYWRKLAWASATFALMADVAMGMLGGDLKRKEKLTGRFADIFSWMYLGTAVLRRFEAEGRRPADAPFFHWAMQHAFAQIHVAFQGLFRNMDVPILGWLLRGPVALWSRLNPIGTPPADWVGHKVAQAMQQPGEDRDLFTTGIFLPSDENDQLQRLENALALSMAAAPVLKKIKDAVRSRKLPRERPEKLVEQARQHDIITKGERFLVRAAAAACDEVVAVDSFTLAQYLETQARTDAEVSSATQG
jgi:acyl-CoA dehydrogenase